MSHTIKNRGVFHIFHEKMSQLRQVKGVTKKKLKAQEYNLKRKLGICYRCDSTNHTLAKCPEKALKHDKKTDICVPHENKELCRPKLMETITKNYPGECSNLLTNVEVDKVETYHENKELQSQQFMEIVTKNYQEECSNMLTDTEVDNVDNLLLENLLKTLGPSPKMWSISRQTSLNTQKDFNQILNGEEVGNFSQSQENIQYETINSEEILNHTIPIDAPEIDTGEGYKNMATNQDKCLYVSYAIEEDYIPLVISSGKDMEKSENLPAKKKKSTRKVGRPKKSATNPAVDFKNMSNNSENFSPTSNNEDFIPLVIQSVIGPETS